jgi:hypothetical protein
MLLTAQIWDAQKQELAGHVGATSRRIASKVAEVLHAGKTATRRQGYRFKLGTKTSGGRWPMTAMGQKRTSAKIICLLCELHQRERGASIWAVGVAERFTYFKRIVALPMSLTTREVLRFFVMAITSCIICSYNVVVAMPAYRGGDNEVQVSNQLDAGNCRHHRGCADRENFSKFSS